MKRITGSSETEGVDKLAIGDVLQSIDGKPVNQVEFHNILKFLQVSKAPSHTLLFTRTVVEQAPAPAPEEVAKQSDEMYTRMSALLEETLRRVSEAEDTVRMSVAMSFAA